MHCEMQSIKADVASRKKSQNPSKTPDRDRKALVSTFNERILQLERQLHEKQYVIEKLFDGPRQNSTTSFHEIPNGQAKMHHKQKQKKNKRESHATVPT